MRSKPSQTKSKENDMYVSRDPALMVLLEHVRRHVELFVRDGGKIERLPDYNAVTITTRREGRKAGCVMSTSVSMSHHKMTLEVIKTYGERVCVFGSVGTYPVLVVQIPPEHARQLAADLIAAADRIESISPTPPDPAAASLPAAGGDFFNEVG